MKNCSGLPRNCPPDRAPNRLIGEPGGHDGHDPAYAHAPRRDRPHDRGSRIAGAASGAMIAPVQAQTERKTFVLVHGSSAGGWCYRRVADLLGRRGHKVFAPTLTGLGERSHLMSGMITLETHITDVVNVIRWESLENFVLVGHSYGGWIISGAAEQCRDRAGAQARGSVAAGAASLGLEGEREGHPVGAGEIHRAADRGRV